MIGRVLSNRYKLITELGSGGMAWVYLAEDRRAEQRVAVKILYPQLSQDVGFLQRFTQEAKLAMSLAQSSPEKHVARILDYGSDRDTHYLVMEYVDGRDLRRVLEEDGTFTWQETFEIARQVALALGHAHQHGIVHRDIKPENIMLLPDGTVRVLDFGVARARTSPTLTHSGFVGSPYYAAPEQAMGQRVDIRADLYSLGIVMYQMLTGELPFQSDTPWAIINHHIATPPPYLKDSHPDLPTSVAQMIRKSMSKRPEDRYQTPAAMVQVIEVVLSGLDLPFDSRVEEIEALAPLLDGLYQRAQQASEDQEWQEAVDLYSQILKLDPRYQDVTDKLAEAGRQARLAALYSAAGRALKAGHWVEALDQLEEIMSIKPDYRDAKGLLIHTCETYELDRLYRRGVERLEAKDWAEAIELLSKVQAQDPQFARTTEYLKTARAEQAKNQEAGQPSGIDGPLARQAAHPRRRSLVWATVAVLILALLVEVYFFYRTQQPPVSASVSAAATDSTSTVTVAIALRDPRTALPTIARPQSLPAPPSTPTPIPATPTPEDTATPTLTPTIPPSATPQRLISAAAPLPTLSPTASLTYTHTPTPTFTLTLTPSLTPEPPLTGQIAFPRFDPIRGTYDVYVCRVDGANCRRVAIEASQPDLLPSSNQLVVHSWKAGDTGVILQTLSGQRIWQITNGLEVARPSVDFQGKHYVYHSRKEADRQPRLYRTYGAEIHPIQREASTVPGHSPSWLPDGDILYSGCVGDACGIIAMRGDGTYPRQIAAGSTETNPEASPDGQRVAFMSHRDNNWEIYVVKLDGSGLQRLTRNPANDGLPVWSPNGKHIAYVSDRDGAWAVWVMRPDGSKQQRLFGIDGPLDGRVRNVAPHETHGWVEERISWSPLP
jgi:tetratricopeptide (TPR) repeat protein/predicted Ser/Thr protein kinase